MPIKASYCPSANHDELDWRDVTHMAIAGKICVFFGDTSTHSWLIFHCFLMFFFGGGEKKWKGKN